MKFAYQFQRLCGSIYTGGNVVFTPDGNSLLSPVGNRITNFDLINNATTTYACESRKDIDRMAVSHDARLLLAVDKDGHCIALHLKKGVILYRIKFGKPVKAMEFSWDDRFIAISFGNKVQIWKTPNISQRVFKPFTLYRTYGGHYGNISSIQFSYDSKFFVTGSEDLSARIFSVDSYPNYKPSTLVGHRDVVIGAYFSIDSRQVYTVGRDGGAFVWEYKDLKEMTAIEDTTDASCESDEKRIPPMARSHLQWFTKLKHVFKMHFAKVTCSTYHAAAKLLVVGFGNGTFGIYETPELKNIHTLSITQEKIDTVAINASGDWLAFASKSLGQLLVWEWKSETYCLKQQGHYFDMNVVDYSLDGRHIVTGADDAKVKLWDANTGFCFVTFSEHVGPVTGVRFTSNGQAVFSCSLDGTVRAFDLNRYRNFRVMTTPDPMQFTCLALDTSGQIVCAGALDQFNIYVWSVQNGRLTDVLSGHTAPITSLAFSTSASSEPVLASGSWDHTVRLWNIYQSKSFIEPLAHSTDVLAVAIRPDGKELCSATLNGYLNIWNVSDGELVGTIDGLRDIAGGRKSTDKITAKNNSISRHFTSLCYSADGICILAGGRSKYICIYETTQQFLLKKYQISHNRSLEGVSDYLNSSEMTAAGVSRSELQSNVDNAGLSDGLVGASRAVDPGSRRKQLEILSKAVLFSPTGRSWVAATTEGLLIYALDENLVFDPFDLDEDITPETIISTIKKKEYTKGLMMALHLNEEKLTRLCLESVPVENIILVARGVKDAYVIRLLGIVAKQIDSSLHLEFYLRWCLSLLNSHGSKLQNDNQISLSGYRAIQKSASQHLTDLARVCDDNQFTLEYMRNLYRLKRRDVALSDVAEADKPM